MSAPRAFPKGIESNHPEHLGMTLRDYFAAAALNGLLSNPKLRDEIVKNGGARGSWIEESSFAFADAMLERRGTNA